MSIAQGTKSKLVFSEEAIYGTAPVGEYTEAGFISEDLFRSKNVIEDDLARGTATMGVPVYGNAEVDGTLLTDLTDRDYLFLFFEHLLGSRRSTTTITPPTAAVTTAYVRGDIVLYGSHFYVCTVAGTTGNPITLVSGEKNQVQGTAEFDWMAPEQGLTREDYVGGDSFLTPGLTFEKQLLGQATPYYFSYPGMRFDSFQLNVPQEGTIECEWGLRGLTEVPSASSVATSTALIPPAKSYAGKDAVAFIDSSTVARPINELEISIDNGVSGDTHQVGGQNRVSLSLGTRSVRGSFVSYFEDTTEYDKFNTESKFKLSLVLINAPGVLLLEVPEIIVAGTGTPSVTGSGVVSATYQFTAGKSSGGTVDFKLSRYKRDEQVAAGDYLIDEFSNYVVDESGNRIAVVLA